MLLKGRVALVSGVGPGIGRATAVAFAREGADVVLSARTEAKAAEVGAEIEAAGGRALCVPADVAIDEQRRRLVDGALERFGRLDVLVANAYAMGAVGPMQDMDLARDWAPAFAVNVFGVLGLAQAVVPAMKRQGGGSIVLVNSMAGRRPEPGMAGYGASKAALLHAARSLATELGPDEIRVNTVVPGWVDGPSLRVHFKLEARKRGVSEDEVYREVAGKGLLPRIATAEQVAEAITFFASDMAAGVTGQSLDVNAGAWLD